VNVKCYTFKQGLQSLQILNLKDSNRLCEIHNIEYPNLETLILWNCRSLVHVCKTIGGLQKLALLVMSGCENLFKRTGKKKHTPFFVPV
jgi:hypothetical protein